MYLRTFLLTTLLFSLTAVAFGQANGKLQIHFMDVGQGDGAILISPRGETVLFDNGDAGECDLPVSYLRTIGISRIDYMIVSHYHSDHFGCTKEVLDEFPLRRFAYDRGREPERETGSFRRYVRAVGDKRTTATSQTVITLDSATANPVTINIVALNANGINSRNENDNSVAAVIHFGTFDAVMAGDLSGFNTSRYRDIETSVASKVGQVEVYKANHHGSDHSSNPTWLRIIKPRIAIISAGAGNDYGHPTPGAIQRMHTAGIAKTYWTEEGAGARPVRNRDEVANGRILVQVVPGASNFTVSYGANRMDTHDTWRRSEPRRSRRRTPRRRVR